MNKIELLAPAGDMDKLKTAFYFGADAAYVGGKKFSLRAMAGNFTDGELKEAVDYAHSLDKKLYVTVNIFARNSDFKEAEKYFKYLEKIGADGAIISDAGLIALAREAAPKLPINVSTQASALNSAAVKFWAAAGAKRVILARELSIKEIAEIHAAAPDTEIEVFVHGAMCVSYSGRCLLSNYLNGRDGNRGECVQACRWQYEIREKNRGGDYLTVEEDARGSYILNSKDLNMINRIAELATAGAISFKIEGRMKSEYYLATVINAYRRALDAYYAVGAAYKDNPLFSEEVAKTAHRTFTEAYAFGDNKDTLNYEDSQSRGTRKFIANVLSYDGAAGCALIEMRNRFKIGDELEVLSPTDAFNKKIRVERLENEDGEAVEDAKLVQQRLKLFTNVKLSAGDILRMEIKEDKVLWQAEI